MFTKMSEGVKACIEIRVKTRKTIRAFLQSMSAQITAPS